LSCFDLSYWAVVLYFNSFVILSICVIPGIVLFICLFILHMNIINASFSYELSILNILLEKFVDKIILNINISTCQ
jgi:hypothetical protein